MMPQLGSYLLIDPDCGLMILQDLTTYLPDDHTVSWSYHTQGWQGNVVPL